MRMTALGVNVEGSMRSRRSPAVALSGFSWLPMVAVVSAACALNTSGQPDDDTRRDADTRDTDVDVPDVVREDYADREDARPDADADEQTEIPEDVGPDVEDVQVDDVGPEDSGPECDSSTECDNGLFCDGPELCVGGVCTAGTPPDCGDTVPCTLDICDEGADGCSHVPDHTACAPGGICDRVVGCLAYGGSPSLPGVSCLDIKTTALSTTDGIYWIDPTGAGSSFAVYCDMTRDAGGWTLVLQNNAPITPGPDPSYAEVVNGVNVTGTFGSDLTAFDLFLGLAYWMPLGTRLRLEVGSSPTARTNQAIYDFSLNRTTWSISFGPGSVTIGAAEPGLKTYSAAGGWGISTRDHDADARAGSCALLCGYAWWYGDCWLGSFWGSRLGGYADAAHWASFSDSHAYGALWVR